MELLRQRELDRLAVLVARNPIVAIIGARQVGKTTLAGQFGALFSGPVTRFDLEKPSDLARLADPMLALDGLEGLVILDEIQRAPNLFPVLRVLADADRGGRTRFLLLGSASPDLLQHASESLAGRIAYHRLGGFALDEVGPDRVARLWTRGGFPRAFLADQDDASVEWRQDFIQTFLERDLGQLGIRIPAETLRRFWTMLAHYHAQVWNGAELARAFGVAGTTVRRYLDTLTGALVVRQLAPWYENIAKRQVKSPKVLVEDTGLLHALLGVRTFDELLGHPKVGASWESFAGREVARRLGARPEECYFWSTHGGAELDLLVVRGRTKRAFEFKYTTAPRTTRSMHTAIEDLRLDRLDVIHAGTEVFPLTRQIRAVPLTEIDAAVAPL
jgi:uncharacterized protein